MIVSYHPQTGIRVEPADGGPGTKFCLSLSSYGCPAILDVGQRLPVMAKGGHRAGTATVLDDGRMEIQLEPGEMLCELAEPFFELSCGYREDP